MNVNFIVYGEPRGKGRPRFSAYKDRNTGKTYGKAHTPDETVAYVNLVRLEYERQCAGKRFPDDAMLDMRIKAYYSIPKSKSKKMKALMLNGAVRPTKKPDIDNVVKVIADSLNQRAYRDDTQIVDCQCRKFYSDVPRVEVLILDIKKGEE